MCWIAWPIRAGFETSWQFPLDAARDFGWSSFILVALGTHAGDIGDAKKLLVWISQLGERKQHCMLLAVDAGTPFDQVIELRELAETMFREVRVTTNGHTVVGWPAGPSSLFKTAATYIREKWPQPWIWLESDAIPLRAGWLDAIEEDYRQRGAKFLGCIYHCTQPFLPEQVMSAIACYPPDAIEILPILPQSPRPWDVDGAEVMLKNGEHTRLVYHFYGQQNLPPTFVARKTPHSPINAMTLEDIPREAVLFHRNKDRSLIRLLERKLFPEQFREKIIVAMNVHAGDVALAVLHSTWLRKLGRRWDHKAIICHDPSCPVVMLNHLEQNLRHCFTEVESFVYQRPPIPTYPASANWAFQSVALHMTNQNSPWFWFEADGVALKPDWLDQIQAEYERCGASWMGPHVRGMQHANGVMVYPFDAARRMPNTMRCGHHQAFDMVAASDIMQDCHDCDHLLFHTWSILNGEWCPVGGGAVPSGITLDLAAKIPKSAVVIHRVKDSSLVQLLLSGQYRH